MAAAAATLGAAPRHRWKPLTAANTPHPELARLTGRADAPDARVGPTLWYRQPARVWTDALPVGNGRLGAMDFGGVEREDIQLNEDSIWEGYPLDRVNPEARQALPELRTLLFEGREQEAARLIGEKMMGVPARIRSYQPLGDLIIESPELKAASNYRRELDLATGTAKTRFDVPGGALTRSVFASHPEQVVVVRLRAEGAAKIDARFSFERPQAQESAGRDAEGFWIKVAGQIASQYVDADKQPWGPVKPGMKFEGLGRLRIRGGSAAVRGKEVVVSGADEVTVLIAARTDYVPNGTLSGADPHPACLADLDRVSAESFAALHAAQMADVRRLFSRVSFHLGPRGAPDSALPTDERLQRVAERGLASDPGLLPLYFQYGRYLLLSSSRPGSMPANLQGLWNCELNASWNSDYHTNINLQMNYWPAEVTNLSECQQPLFDFMDHLAVSGAKTAREEYGCGGWVVHHLTDPFLVTTPCDGAAGMFPMAAAWLAQHPWEHYAFTGDRKFLRDQSYPLMKGAAQFVFDFLVPAPAGSPVAGRLVTCPSESPENTYYLPNGEKASFTYAATMDLEIIHDLLTHCIKASETLGVDAAFRARCERTLRQLAPLQIGPDGRLQEWVLPYREVDIHHRHTSHLFAVYPGDEITVDGTPALARAAEKSLIVRGDRGATEWSLAWRCALWARFQDGERAYGQLDRLLRYDLYRNLFNRYPPFQIDGNLGATAAIAEMLLQSQGGVVRLLPALPAEWNTGSVSGLRARGGFEVGMNWAGGRLTEAHIRSTLGGRLVLMYGAERAEIETQPGIRYTWAPGKGFGGRA